MHLRRLVAVALIAAGVGLAAGPAQAAYPPNGGDCTVTGISTQSGLQHGKTGLVRVAGSNVGSNATRCRISLTARRISPRSGPIAPDFPGAFRIRVAPGGNFGVFFGVLPPFAGTYRVVACATSVNARGRGNDVNNGNNCKVTTVTVG
jgi:hypothetical protein